MSDSVRPHRPIIYQLSLWSFLLWTVILMRADNVQTFMTDFFHLVHAFKVHLCCDTYQQFFLSLINFISQCSFKFIAKLNRKNKQFPYTSIYMSPYIHNLFHTDTFHTRAGTLLTISKPITHYYHAELIVCIQAHCWWCTSCGFGHMYNGIVISYRGVSLS